MLKHKTGKIIKAASIYINKYVNFPITHLPVFIVLNNVLILNLMHLYSLNMPVDLKMLSKYIFREINFLGYFEHPW